MATIILGTGNDTVSVGEGPVVKVNTGSNAAWNNQVFDGAAGVDTLSVNEFVHKVQLLHRCDVG